MRVYGGAQRRQYKNIFIHNERNNCVRKAAAANRVLKSPHTISRHSEMNRFIMTKSTQEMTVVLKYAI